MKTVFREPIPTLRLSATDLRRAALEEDADGDVAEAYRITIFDDDGREYPNRAEALYLPGDGRIGMAWGADADWTDSSGDVARDIDAWLNDADWEPR